MSKPKNLYILGYSGHAYVVIDVAMSRDYVIKGYFDFERGSKNPYDLSYLGDENKEDLVKIVGNDLIFPAVGSNEIRRKLYDFLKANNFNQTILIDNSANISAKANIGDSTLIAPSVVVNSGTTIGNACIINTGVIIEHECKIADFVHIAPGAVLAGNVAVGADAFLGANCVVKQGVTIGKNVIVGAGAVVINDIPEGETWAGNPAKTLK